MSSPLADALLRELDDDALVQLARRLAPLLVEVTAPADELLDVDEAAEHLRCHKRRIYDLVNQHRLQVERDGRRLLFRRSALDRYLNTTPGDHA